MWRGSVEEWWPGTGWKVMGWAERLPFNRPDCRLIQTWLISGAVIVEIVFVRPGFGTLIISGVQFRDYQLIQGMLVVLVTVFVTANVVADIAYGFVDPRIRVS